MLCDYMSIYTTYDVNLVNITVEQEFFMFLHGSTLIIAIIDNIWALVQPRVTPLKCDEQLRGTKKLKYWYFFSLICVSRSLVRYVLGIRSIKH